MTADQLMQLKNEALGNYQHGKFFDDRMW